MIAFDEAAARIEGLALPLGSERVPLEDADGRVLARPAVARRASPATAVSAMDGYAVREADLTGGATRLRVVGQAFAGAAFEAAIGPGECVRIFTGAPAPAGADRVVIQEEVVRQGDVAVFGPPAGRRHLRAAASDFDAGEVLVEAGVRLGPGQLVAAAAADLAVLDLVRRPQVVILSTGDELRAPGACGRPDAIPESVSFGVAALARRWGAKVVGRWRLGDALPELESAASHALGVADVVVVTGGASVGERDLAKAMFGPNLELVVPKVAIKPGKPVWVGRREGTTIVGLPGNPSAAMITARLFLAPLLAGLGGADPASALAWRSAPLAAQLSAGGDREGFLRARRRGDAVEPLEDQDSSGQKGLALAELLVRRAAGAPEARIGEPVVVLDV